MTRDKNLVSVLEADWKRAPLEGSDRAMLKYVEKLTRTPWDMIRSDIDVLREQGFSDSGILDINQVASYYAFANRIANGLGLELEAVHNDDEQ